MMMIHLARVTIGSNRLLKKHVCVCVVWLQLLKLEAVC